MHEILFCGFNICEGGDKTVYVGDKKVKGLWVVGWYQQITCGYNGQNGNVTQIITFKKINNGEIIITGIFDVLPSTVGQYTGLTDKHEKKAFVGSICYDNNYNKCFTITWNKTHLTLMAEFTHAGKEHLADIWNDNCAVIGNIHEMGKNGRCKADVLVAIDSLTDNQTKPGKMQEMSIKKSTYTAEMLAELISAAEGGRIVVLSKWVHLGGDEYCCDNCGFVIHTEGSWENPHEQHCSSCGAITKETKRRGRNK